MQVGFNEHAETVRSQNCFHIFIVFYCITAEKTKKFPKNFSFQIWILMIKGLKGDYLEQTESFHSAELLQNFRSDWFSFYSSHNNKWALLVFLRKKTEFLVSNLNPESGGMQVRRTVYDRTAWSQKFSFQFFVNVYSLYKSRLRRLEKNEKKSKMFSASKLISNGERTQLFAIILRLL